MGTTKYQLSPPVFWLIVGSACWLFVLAQLFVLPRLWPYVILPSSETINQMSIGGMIIAVAAGGAAFGESVSTALGRGRFLSALGVVFSTPAFLLLCMIIDMILRRSIP